MLMYFSALHKEAFFERALGAAVVDPVHEGLGVMSSPWHQICLLV